MDVNDFTQDLEKKIFDVTFKGAVEVTLSNAVLLSIETKGRSLARYRKQVLFIEMCGMRFRKHHQFIGIFDQKTQQLFTGGFIEHFLREETEQLNWKRFANLYPKGPTVLNLKKLEPGFVIWISSVSFALIAFAFEWTLAFRDYLVMKYLLKSFFETQKIRSDKVKQEKPEVMASEENEVDLDSESVEQSELSIIVEKIDSLDGCSEGFSEACLSVERRSEDSSLENLCFEIENLSLT